MKKVWPDTFVEEVNLAKNVSSLRKILGSEQSEHYIETIPKRGYRFVAGCARGVVGREFTIRETARPLFLL
jgi:DNA-binding winged helix-turn-helix (wHTH) protein